MQKDYVCYFQKECDGATIKDSLADFGFAVQEAKWPELEIKDLPSRSWPEDNGEDVYIPSVLPVKAAEADFSLVYWGDIGTAKLALNKIVKYLYGNDGTGASLLVYNPFNRCGYCGMYAKKVSEITYKKSNIDEVLTMKVTFNIPDPTQECKLTFKTDGSINKLAKA